MCSISCAKGGAHISFDDFIADFPEAFCGQMIPGLPYTAWQVLEHMRIAQWDILEFRPPIQNMSRQIFQRAIGPNPTSSEMLTCGIKPSCNSAVT